jgi:DNA-binding XRE family transcriptional regulator
MYQYIKELKFLNIDKNHLNNNIALYRKKAGYSQTDFAEKIGITQQNMSLYENNKNFPKSYEIDLMLKALGNVTFEELFDTGRVSVYISKSNQKSLLEYVESLNDVFSAEHTNYQKMSFVVNHILRLFFEGRLGSSDIKESIKEAVDEE